MTQIGKAVALVTGGASGIGLLTAQRLAAAGAARVVLWDIDAAALDRAVAGLRAQGRAADGIVVDLSQPAAIAANWASPYEAPIETLGMYCLMPMMSG